MNEDELLTNSEEPTDPGGGKKPAEGPAASPLITELNQIKEKKWRSILMPEDLLVAAMQKGLLRSGEQVRPAAAYQAVRDVIGELMDLIRKSGNPGIEDDLRSVLKGSDGSGGGDRMMPLPNP